MGNSCARRADTSPVVIQLHVTSEAGVPSMVLGMGPNPDDVPGVPRPVQAPDPVLDAGPANVPVAPVAHVEPIKV